MPRSQESQNIASSNNKKTAQEVKIGRIVGEEGRLRKGAIRDHKRNIAKMSKNHGSKNNINKKGM